MTRAENWLPTSFEMMRPGRLLAISEPTVGSRSTQYSSPRRGKVTPEGSRGPVLAVDRPPVGIQRLSVVAGREVAFAHLCFEAFTFEALGAGRERLVDEPAE